MPEREPPSLPDRPDPLILTAQDADVLAYILPAEDLDLFTRANRGEVFCPQCDQPLLGMVMIAEEYEGLTLVCLGCGCCEY